MTETLLRGNRRIGLLVAFMSAIGVLLGLAICRQTLGASWWGGGLLLVISCLMLLTAAWVATFPRVAINESELCVYLRGLRPIRVPIDVVEVFFIGQGAVKGDDPGQPNDYKGAVAANVIVRLAEAAHDWKERDVFQPLGIWKDGYITVRGLWCENIDSDVLKAMNRRLSQIKRQRKADQANSQ